MRAWERWESFRRWERVWVDLVAGWEVMGGMGIDMVFGLEEVLVVDLLDFLVVEEEKERKKEGRESIAGEVLFWAIGSYVRRGGRRWSQEVGLWRLL